MRKKRKKKGENLFFFSSGPHFDNRREQNKIVSERKKMDPQLLNSLPEEDKTKMVAMIETMQTRDRWVEFVRACVCVYNDDEEEEDCVCEFIFLLRAAVILFSTLLFFFVIWKSIASLRCETQQQSNE